MERIEFKKLVNDNEKVLDKTTNWMYNWWGKRDGYSFEEVKCFMKCIQYGRQCRPNYLGLIFKN